MGGELAKPESRLGSTTEVIPENLRVSGDTPKKLDRKTRRSSADRTPRQGLRGSFTKIQNSTRKLSLFKGSARNLRKQSASSAGSYGLSLRFPKLPKKISTPRMSGPKKIKADGAIQISWLQLQKEVIQKGDPITPALLRKGFADVFQHLSFEEAKAADGSVLQRKSIPKHAFLNLCRSLWGSDVDSFFFLKLFEYIDCDGNGRIDEIEFSIVSCFLLNKDADLSNTRLAYKLFDTNRDGGISQKEFSEMLAALVGGSPRHVLSNHVFRPVFEEFARDRYLVENLEFYKDLSPYFEHRTADVPEFDQIGLGEAEEVVAKFFDKEAKLKLNLAFGEENKVIKAVDDAKMKGEAAVSLQFFDHSYNEVSKMLRSNAFAPFKEFLREKPYSKITSDTWARFKKKPNQTLNYKHFEKWTNEIPGIFDFLDHLQDEFALLIEVLQSKITPEEEADLLKSGV